MKNLKEELKLATPYMIRNDGKIFPITGGEYTCHPYVIPDVEWLEGDPDEDFEYWAGGVIEDGFENDIIWFYKNTNQKLVKDGIAAVVKYVHDYTDLDTSVLTQAINIQQAVKITDITTAWNTIVNVNDKTNQEFLRMRTSDSYNSGSGKGIYFRVSSDDFNWFNIIWLIVYDNRRWATDVTITEDHQSGKGNEIYEINGLAIDKMPVEEFINLGGNPIIEELNESNQEKQAFVDKFGEDLYNAFVKYKDRLDKVMVDGQPVSKDLSFHVKHTSPEDMSSIISRAEDRRYRDENTATEMDVEGRPIPAPRHHEKLVYNQDGIKIYLVDNMEDMINLSSDKYGGIIGKWCVAGRYDTNGLVKVSQAKEYFSDYVKSENLPGYYVIIDATDSTGIEKYCLLVNRDGSFVSLWDSSDDEIDITDVLQQEKFINIFDSLGIGTDPTREVVNDLLDALETFVRWGSDEEVEVRFSFEEFLELLIAQEKYELDKAANILNLSYSKTMSPEVAYELVTKHFKNMGNHLMLDSENKFAKEHPEVLEAYKKVPNRVFLEISSFYISNYSIHRFLPQYIDVDNYYRNHRGYVTLTSTREDVIEYAKDFIKTNTHLSNSVIVRNSEFDRLIENDKMYSVLCNLDSTEQYISSGLFNVVWIIVKLVSFRLLEEILKKAYKECVCTWRSESRQDLPWCWTRVVAYLEGDYRKPSEYFDLEVDID